MMIEEARVRLLLDTLRALRAARDVYRNLTAEMIRPFLAAS